MNKERLPDGWEWENLDGVTLEYISGGTPSTKVTTYWQGSIPWTRSANLTANYLKFGEKFISREAVAETATNVVPKNNVLVATRVGVGKATVNLIDVAISQDLTGLVLDVNRILPIYLVYYLHSPKIQRLFEQYSRGTTIQGIQRSDLSRIKIPLPPLDTQRKIVAILDKAEATQRLRAEADALTQDLPQSVFLEMFGDPATNPLEWTIKKLGDVCSEIYRYPTFYGFEYVNSGTPIIRIGNIRQDGIVDPNLTNYVFIDQVINDRFPRTKIELYDILMAVRGDGSTAKRIGLVHSNDLIGANISPNLLRIKTDGKRLNPIYLFNLLVSESGQKILERYVTRTAKKTITAQNIKEISIPIPPLSLQNKFEKLILSTIGTQDTQDQSNVKLSNLFNNISAKAFTGALIT